jgi:hypothetical protein
VGTGAAFTAGTGGQLLCLWDDDVLAFGWGISCVCLLQERVVQSIGCGLSNGASTTARCGGVVAVLV